MTDYPKTKAAGSLNIWSAIFSIIAGAGIAYLIFSGKFRIVPEGEENGLENLGLIVILPMALIHVGVLILSFLTQLIRGLRLKAAANSGEISLASYIATLIFKLIYLIASALAIILYLDVKVGGMVAVILTLVGIIPLFITMIFEFATKNEILDEE